MWLRSCVAGLVLASPEAAADGQSAGLRHPTAYLHDAGSVVERGELVGVVELGWPGRLSTRRRMAIRCQGRRPLETL
eukprot:3155921-Pyramimonas_sp.AAC.1